LQVPIFVFSITKTVPHISLVAVGDPESGDGKLASRIPNGRSNEVFLNFNDMGARAAVVENCPFCFSTVGIFTLRH
jgi:hypothetical protein